MFPHNVYILPKAKKPRHENRKSRGFEECPEHGKELNMFCDEKGCQKPICASCFMRKHKKHEVLEIEDKQKQEFEQNIDSIEGKSEAIAGKILIIKQQIESKT